MHIVKWGEDLPKARGVYVLEGAYLDGILFKVGVAGNLGKRFRGYMRSGGTWLDDAPIDWAQTRYWLYDDELESRLVERRLLCAMENYAISGYIIEQTTMSAIGGDIFYTTEPILWPERLGAWALGRLGAWAYEHMGVRCEECGNTHLDDKCAECLHRELDALVNPDKYGSGLPPLVGG